MTLIYLLSTEDKFDKDSCNNNDNPDEFMEDKSSTNLNHKPDWLAKIKYKTKSTKPKTKNKT